MYLLCGPFGPGVLALRFVAGLMPFLLRLGPVALIFSVRKSVGPLGRGPTALPPQLSDPQNLLVAFPNVRSLS